MLERFRQFIFQQKLISPGEKTLLAASAGVDSTALFHLFLEAGLPFAVGHCNFQLRGEDSERDEDFVKNLASAHGIDCVSIRFDTAAFAEKNKTSIQEAARLLRYEWLEDRRRQLACEHIATAHHLDDSIETALFNFARGCGIRGLHGILPRNERLIRPLLFASKKEILEFAVSEGIRFREDASNLKDKYSRNKIRLHAIPVFEQINPAFQKSAATTIAHIRETEQLFDFAIQTIRREVVQGQGDRRQIEMGKLLSYPAPKTVLYELLRPFGFGREQIGQMLQSIDSQPGQIFYSPNWRLLADRDFFILEKNINLWEEKVVPEIPAAPLLLPDGSRLSIREKSSPPSVFPNDSNVAWMDLDRLSFPLKLRHWQDGDSFQPLGMEGRSRKLQDFFSDRKLSRFQKEKIWLLESDGSIAWVVGMRLDERFKARPDTKRFLVFHFQE